MKQKIINYCMGLVKSQNRYDDIKLAEIRYGLEAIYILITKTIIIFSIATLLSLLKELVVFLLLYNLIRMPSFGLHATKSWICLLSSTIIFIVVPYLCSFLQFSISIKCMIGIVAILFIYKNAPADTHKRPIINKQRRMIYKTISTFIAVAFTFVALYIKNDFISNALLLSLIVQCFMISPLIYRLFKLPYNNYKKYELQYSY